jgi:hypothetical protein
MELHRGLDISYRRDTADMAFGPERHDVFDFTLLFEQSILGILPSGLFILVSIARATTLWQVKTCVRAGWLLWAKLVSRSLGTDEDIQFCHLLVENANSLSSTQRRRLQR